MVRVGNRSAVQGPKVGGYDVANAGVEHAGMARSEEIAAKHRSGKQSKISILAQTMNTEC